MAHAANDNRPESQLIIVPDAWQGDRHWTDLSAGVQDRIGVALQGMYADLLQQPLSPRLKKLIRQIEARLETSRHAG
jgi:hypothetical protein